MRSLSAAVDERINEINPNLHMKNIKMHEERRSSMPPMKAMENEADVPLLFLYRSMSTPGMFFVGFLN